MFYTVLWNQLIYGPRKLSVVFLYLEKKRTKNVQYFFSNSAYVTTEATDYFCSKVLKADAVWSLLLIFTGDHWTLPSISWFLQTLQSLKKKLSDWYNHKETSDAAIENNRLDRLVSSLILTIVATIRKKAIERVPEVFLERLWESYGT